MATMGENTVIVNHGYGRVGLGLVTLIYEIICLHTLCKSRMRSI